MFIITTTNQIGSNDSRRGKDFPANLNKWNIKCLVKCTNLNVFLEKFPNTDKRLNLWNLVTNEI